MESLEREAELDRRRWVEPALSEGDVDAGWDAVRDRSRPHRRGSRGRLAAAAAMVAVAAGVGLAFLFTAERPVSSSPWAGTSLSTGDEPMVVALSDGSSIDARPHTRLELLEGNERMVRLALRRGEARFEVMPDEARDFVVVAGDVTVRVVGTVFSVAAGSDTRERLVEVEVERGRVEVSVDDERRVLGGGETWRRRRPETAEAAAAEGERQEAERAGEAQKVEEAAEPDRARPARRARARRVPDPAALLERATEARRAGRTEEAAGTYEILVTRHGRDSRAPLAAIELGRLRMDSLNDPAGAAEAFELALRLGPSSPLREDALARLVRARHASGSPAACRDARARYLAAYPEGRWRTDVERRCTDP